MKDSETTNTLLFLILIVLLVGFGFLAPMLWIIGGVLGIWFLLRIIGTVTSSVGKFVNTTESLVRKFISPVWKPVNTLIGNNILQWCIIAAGLCFSAWFYYSTQEMGYLLLLEILSIVALIKAVNHWDTITIHKRFKRDDNKNA